MADSNVTELNTDGSLMKFLAEIGCVLSFALGRLNAKYKAGKERIESRIKMDCASNPFNKKGAISKASMGPESCKLLLTPNAIPWRECCNA